MKKQSLLFLLISFLGVFKYFYDFTHRAMFDFDQEYLSLQAKSILIDKKMTLIGAPTSVGGMFIAPLYNYFMALAHLVGGMSPYTVEFIGNCWAVINILALFIIGQRLFGLKAGFFSSIMALISFEFIRPVGLPPLLFPLPLISLLLFYLLTKQNVGWFWLAILLGLSFQLHFTAIFFLPMVLLMIIFNKPTNLKTKYFIFTTLIILIFYYQFNLKNKPDPVSYPTVTLIQPHFWHGIKSDYIFGDIGVGLPKE